MSSEDMEFVNTVIQDLGGGRVGIHFSVLEEMLQRDASRIIPIATYLSDLIGVDLVEEGRSAETIMTSMLREVIDYRQIEKD